MSPLSLQACRERLDAAIDSPWMLFGTKSVIGTAQTGRLIARKRKFYRNSFQTRLVARMEEVPDGTRITCHYGMHPLAAIFMVIWLGFATLIAAAFLVHILKTGGADWNWVGVVPFAMPVFGYAMLRFGKYLARDEAYYLSEFVITTVEGRSAA
jgi:hypothetical protein